MNYTFKSILAEFNQIFKEKKSLKKSEIFRRIYKLPVKPIEGKKLQDTKLLIENNEYYTIDQVERLYKNWEVGLNIFTNETLNSLLSEIEEIFIQENPNFYKDNEQETIQDSLNLVSEKDLRKSLLKEELKKLSLSIPDVKSIKEKYQNAIKQVESQADTRKLFNNQVFNWNPGRFKQFILSKDRLNFLTPKELKNLDFMATMIREETGIDTSPNDIIETLDFEYTAKDLAKRKKVLKQYFDHEMRNYTETLKRSEEIQNELNELEKTEFKTSNNERIEQNEKNRKFN